MKEFSKLFGNFNLTQTTKGSLLLIAFVVLITIGLTGCGSSPEPEPAPAPQAVAPAPTPAPTPAPEPAPDPVTPPPPSEPTAPTTPTTPTTPAPVVSAPVYSNYFATWGGSGEEGQWTVTISENQLRFVRNAQEYYVLSDLRWTEVTNTIQGTRGNYPSGYAISGRVSEISGTFYISGVLAALGGQATTYYFNASDLRSLMGGNATGAPVSEVVYR